jgi:hypothetical protein
MKRSQLKQYQIVPMVKKAIQFSAVWQYWKLKRSNS